MTPRMVRNCFTECHRVNPNIVRVGSAKWLAVLHAKLGSEADLLGRCVDRRCHCPQKAHNENDKRRQDLLAQNVVAKPREHGVAGFAFFGSKKEPSKRFEAVRDSIPRKNTNFRSIKSKATIKYQLLIRTDPISTNTLKTYASPVLGKLPV